MLAYFPITRSNFSIDGHIKSASKICLFFYQCYQMIITFSTNLQSMMYVYVEYESRHT